MPLLLTVLILIEFLDSSWTHQAMLLVTLCQAVKKNNLKGPCCPLIITISPAEAAHVTLVILPIFNFISGQDRQGLLGIPIIFT